MQLFALDQKGEVLSAKEALTKQAYVCLECGGEVRLRAGALRQRHFYHTHSKKNCRQSGKTLAHLHTQLRLQQTLGCVLEKRFDTINRIADAVWEEKNLIFEVQCSPIAAEEVELRNRDYKSLGYQVIWILHDRRYNKRRVSGAEMYLRDHPHYFTDINDKGEGKIYDQFAVYQKGRRSFRLKPVSLTMNQVFSMPKEAPIPLNRCKTWPLYFAKDVCHFFLSNPNSPACKAALQAEKRRAVPWKERFFAPARILFRYFLEKACR